MIATKPTDTRTEFFHDVWRGLNSKPKSLSSKYFYDESGDRIFQEIMDCPEYYLTRCELEIFTRQASELTSAILTRFTDFDVVELGAGDCYKSIHLLRSLVDSKIPFTYYPIDISANVISQLDKKLPAALPTLQMHGLNGDYFDMLEEVKELSHKNKVVLFLGSSIGNFPIEDTENFLKALRARLRPGDLLLTGFDLKKDPSVILAAYNDKQGITRRFNLNLLERINNQLDAGFSTANFAHCPEYNEQTGACKSYLKSLKAQRVRIGEHGWVHFDKDEMIYMEISQKYTLAQTDTLAAASGFAVMQHFFDEKQWFLDTLWQVK